MAKQKQKVPVSLRALTARINRKLAKDDAMLLKVRGRAGTRREFGDYCVVDARSNAVKSTHVSPVELGRELGVLRGWEKVEAKGGAR